MTSQESPTVRVLQMPCAAVLCPTDLSETGDGAVAVAYRLVADGGRVHLMHICEPPFLGNPLYGPYVQGYVPSDEDTQAGETRSLERLKRLVPQDLAKREIHTEFHLVHGVNVSNVIEEEAHRLGCDVVVLGTHGRTGLGRILMGSVATDVVKKKGLPVILVHADLVAGDSGGEDSENGETGPGPGERIVQGFDRLASGLEGSGL